MAKINFYIAFFAAIYIFVYALSASAARERECGRDIDCMWVCPRDGLCQDNGRCWCWPSTVADKGIRCDRDLECQFQCPGGGFCDLTTHTCGCLPADEAPVRGGPAPEPNTAEMADVTHCTSDADC